MYEKNKRIYAVGELCDVCKTPTIQGRYGAYCWPCWSKRKDQNTPQTHQNAPQQEFRPNTTQPSLAEKVDALERRIEKLEYDSLKDPTTGETIPF